MTSINPSFGNYPNNSFIKANSAPKIAEPKAEKTSLLAGNTGDSVIISKEPDTPPVAPQEPEGFIWFFKNFMLNFGINPWSGETDPRFGGGSGKIYS